MIFQPKTKMHQSNCHGVITCFIFFSSQEYVSDLFHYLHNSSESPQLIALLESFLFSVVRDVKHYSSENQRLEEALKRYSRLQLVVNFLLLLASRFTNPFQCENYKSRFWHWDLRVVLSPSFLFCLVILLFLNFIFLPQTLAN